MGTIASRSLTKPRNSHGWATWIVLALPLLGIASFVVKSVNTVRKPTISIFQAIDNNDLKALREHALTGTDLNQLDDLGHSALYEAIAQENDTAAIRLLDYGANPNAGKANLETPLMLAAGQGDLELVNRLLEAHASPNAGPADGMSPLYEGACSGNADVVAALLANGAEPNGALSSGSTPLGVAAWQGNVRMVKLLIDAGARTDAQGYLGRTPLDQARLRRNQKVVEVLESTHAKS